MSETSKELFENFEQAERYVEDVRAHYRSEHGSYQGNRTEDQQLIAMVTSDEARMLVDGVMAGTLAISGAELPRDYESEIERAGYTWGDFRSEFEKMLAGFGVITNRLHRDGYNVPEYTDLKHEDRMKAASVLMRDFLGHNALRFGVDASGVHKTDRKKIYTDDGGVETISSIVDKDKAKNNREIDQNMATRKYRTGVAAHPALKISTEEYKKLRREFPELDKDVFDNAISHYRNVREELESRE